MDFASIFSAAHKAIENHSATIRAGAGSSVATATVPCYVAEADTSLSAVGLAPAAWKWTVSFRSELWTSSVKIDRGATIDADATAAARWPKLTVQECHVCEGIVRLLCSSEEVA